MQQLTSTKECPVGTIKCQTQPIVTGISIHEKLQSRVWRRGGGGSQDPNSTLLTPAQHRAEVSESPIVGKLPPLSWSTNTRRARTRRSRRNVNGEKNGTTTTRKDRIGIHTYADQHKNTEWGKRQARQRRVTDSHTLQDLIRYPASVGIWRNRSNTVCTGKLDVIHCQNLRVIGNTRNGSRSEEDVRKIHCQDQGPPSTMK